MTKIIVLNGEHCIQLLINPNIYITILKPIIDNAGIFCLKTFTNESF